MVSYKDVLDLMVSDFGRVPLFSELPEDIREKTVTTVIRNKYIRECILTGEGKQIIRRIGKANKDGKVSRKWLRKQLLSVADKGYNARQIDAQLDRIRENTTYAAWYKRFSFPIMWDQIATEENRKRGLV